MKQKELQCICTYNGQLTEAKPYKRNENDMFYYESQGLRFHW